VARLKPSDDNDLSPGFRERVRETEVDGGDATVWRVLGLRPDMFEDYLAFYYPAHDEGKVNPALKEIARLRIAQLNDCFT